MRRPNGILQEILSISWTVWVCPPAVSLSQCEDATIFTGSITQQKDSSLNRTTCCSQSNFSLTGVSSKASRCCFEKKITCNESKKRNKIIFDKRITSKNHKFMTSGILSIPWTVWVCPPAVNLSQCEDATIFTGSVTQQKDSSLNWTTCRSQSNFSLTGVNGKAPRCCFEGDIKLPVISLTTKSNYFENHFAMTQD